MCLIVHVNMRIHIHVYMYVLASAMNCGLLPVSKGSLMCALPRPPADDLALLCVCLSICPSICLSLAAKVQSQRSVRRGVQAPGHV